MVTCEDDTAEILRKAGHKLTPQRLMILRALRHAGGHVSAAQIADQVREAYPFVDVSTVYRTLDVLKRMGLATVTDMGSGDDVFEWTPHQPHHHLICSACGYVQEIGNNYFAEVGRKIEADVEFAPDMRHFAVFGLCRECRDQDAE